jgi:hypothetical protein
MPRELVYAIVTAVLMVGSAIIHGGRVLTVPFAFVLILILIYWAARASADREER